VGIFLRKPEAGLQISIFAAVHSFDIQREKIRSVKTQIHYLWFFWDFELRRLKRRYYCWQISLSLRNHTGSIPIWLQSSDLQRSTWDTLLPRRFQSDPPFDHPSPFLIPSHFLPHSSLQHGRVCFQRLIFTADPLATNINDGFFEVGYGVFLTPLRWQATVIEMIGVENFDLKDFYGLVNPRYRPSIQRATFSLKVSHSSCL